VSRRRVLVVLAASVGVLVFVRLRGQLEPWVAFHRWMRDLGVPKDVRQLDSTLLMLGAAVGAALALGARGARGVAEALGLRGSFGRAARFAAIAALPMLVAGAIVGDGLTASWALIPGVLVAPFVEEVFFRGCLVALPARTGGLAFWPVAFVAGALFGASHAPWTGALDWTSLPTFLVTGAGGVWFAWLLRISGWSLWVPLCMQAAMNLAWMAFGVSADAVGGLGANLGRAGTIALAIVLARVTLEPEQPPEPTSTPT